MQPLQGDPRATVIGLCAVLIWGLSALLVYWARSLPTFEFMALCFAMGGALFALWGRAVHGSFNFLHQPWHYYMMAIFFIFVNNAGYTLGMRLSPVVVANLINYLWPLLIVLLSAPILGRPLRWWHAGGALMGFAGCGLLVMRDEQVSFSVDHLLGYFCVFIGALCWAVYSLLLRRFYATVPVQALTLVFFGVALASFLSLPLDWLVDEQIDRPWRWPAGYEILSIIMAGCGTLMLAYACWDYGAKKGDVRVMAAASYLTPLLSTLILAVFAGVSVSSIAWLSCALVIGGALLGSARELFAR